MDADGHRFGIEASVIGRRRGQRSLALELMHGGAFHLAVGVAALEVFALVGLDFAFANGEEDFHFAVFPIEGEGDEGVAFDSNDGEQFADLRFVEEELARGLGNVVLAVAEGVFVDVGVVEPGLPFFDPRERVVDLGLAGADRLHLGAAQLDPGLEALIHRVVAERLPVASSPHLAES